MNQQPKYVYHMDWENPGKVDEYLVLEVYTEDTYKLKGKNGNFITAKKDYHEDKIQCVKDYLLGCHEWMLQISNKQKELAEETVEATKWLSMTFELLMRLTNAHNTHS